MHFGFRDSVGWIADLATGADFVADRIGDVCAGRLRAWRRPHAVATDVDLLLEIKGGDSYVGCLAVFKP